MKITGIVLRNWLNCGTLSMDGLKERVFIIGGNAAGKSNLIDALLFLRDLALPSSGSGDSGGGLQWAVARRGGWDRVCYSNAKRGSPVAVEITASTAEGRHWRYRLAFAEAPSGVRVVEERAWLDNRAVFARPTKADQSDPVRLGQSLLEQSGMNEKIRDWVTSTARIRSFLAGESGWRDFRNGFSASGGMAAGTSLAREIGLTPARERNLRFRRVEKGLKTVLPGFSGLRFFGSPRQPDGERLEICFSSWKNRWRPVECLSEGSQRLFGLLWALSGGHDPLVLDEPERSLNEQVVAQLPGLITRASRRKQGYRQVFISTHSQALLSDPAISPSEVLRLTTSEGEALVQPMEREEVIMSKSGLSVADVLLPGVECGRPGELRHIF